MKRVIAFLLALVMVLVLCACGRAAKEWKLPENTVAYKPSCLVPTNFGSLLMLDAGFTKKAQSVIQVSTTNNRLYNTTTENRHVGYYTAKDGQALFAFKGVLYNESNQAITLEELHPTIRFNDDGTTVMYGYPAVPFGTPEYYSLESGEEVEIVFACTAPNDLYSGNGDILLEFAEGTIGFHRSNLGNYNSIGFTTEDGESAGDLTEVPSVQEKGVIVAYQQHVDEVRGEGISLEYDSEEGEYRIHAKIRNLTGYPLIHEKTPTGIEVHVLFLDANGDSVLNGNIIVGGYGSYTDLAIDQAGWDNSYSFVSKSVIEKAAWVQISSYSFWYQAINSDGSSQTVNGTVTDPFIIALSDILPE